MPKIIEKPSKKELSAFTQRGCGINTIAAHYKCSHRTVNSWMKRYNLKTRRKEPPSKGEVEALFDNDMSQVEAAKELKISLSTLTYLIKRHGIKTKAARKLEKMEVAKTKVLELIGNEPMTARDLAEAVNYSVSTVVKWLGRMKKDGAVKVCRFTFKWSSGSDKESMEIKSVSVMAAIHHSFSVPQSASVAEHSQNQRG